MSTPAEGQGPYCCIGNLVEKVALVFGDSKFSLVSKVIFPMFLRSGSFIALLLCNSRLCSERNLGVLSAKENWALQVRQFFRIFCVKAVFFVC